MRLIFNIVKRERRETHQRWWEAAWTKQWFSLKLYCTRLPLRPGHRVIFHLSSSPITFLFLTHKEKNPLWNKIRFPMEESSSLLLKLTQDQNAHVGKSSGCQQLSLSVMQMKMIFSSVQFTHSVMSYSLRPNGLQHARLPCPSPTPGACSNSCPLSW